MTFSRRLRKSIRQQFRRFFFERDGAGMGAVTDVLFERWFGGRCQRADECFDSIKVWYDVDANPRENILRKCH